ncbi:MAG: Gldg family protein [Lachnospiraceae bacterium]|nr:Gldg family protein [Lachnospiraceae bacterium]
MNKKVNRSIQFKNGSFSLVLTVIAIALVVIINLIFGALSTDKMTYSTSGIDLYALSDTTKQVLKSEVSSDITLYILSDSMGSYDDYSLNLCESYEDECGHIKVKKIDTAVNPSFTSKYDAATASDSSVIVENKDNKKFILIDFNDMHQTTSDDNTQDNTKYKTESYNGEGLLTSAIYKVSTAKEIKVYQLGGHNELFINKENYELLTDALDKSAYRLSDYALDLSAAASMPSDIDILVIFFPQTDISASELELLKTYLDNGGKIAVIHNNINLLDGSTTASTYMNLDKLLEYGGFKLASDFIIENDYDHYMSSAVNYPQELIIPDYGSSVSGSVTSSGKTMAAFASPLYKISGDSDNYEYTDLLITSEKITSYLNNGKGLPAKSLVSGISKLSGDNGGSLFVISDAMFFNLSSIFGSGSDTATANNIRFFVDGMGKLSEKNVDTYVPVKSFERKVNIVANGDVLTFSLIYMALIPLAFIGIGIVVWLMRRSR